MDLGIFVWGKFVIAKEGKGEGNYLRCQAVDIHTGATNAGSQFAFEAEAWFALIVMEGLCKS